LFRHVVLFRFHQDAPPAAIDVALEEVRGLADAVPSVRALEVRIDAGEDADSHDAAVLVTFDDAAGYRAYRDHPEHVRVVADHLRPLISTRAAVQFDVS
jgi:hypothetical protein